jgi:hypothetical protein
MALPQQTKARAKPLSAVANNFKELSELCASLCKYSNVGGCLGFEFLNSPINTEAPRSNYS